MKRTICLMLTLLILGLSLTACGSTGSSKEQTPPPSNTQTATPAQEEKVVHGIINRIDSYLVLLTDDGEYQVMDYGDNVTLDDFQEGDKVDVTYTGELGVEDNNPVITGISKVE